MEPEIDNVVAYFDKLRKTHMRAKNRFFLTDYRGLIDWSVFKARSLWREINNPLKLCVISY